MGHVVVPAHVPEIVNKNVTDSPTPMIFGFPTPTPSIRPKSNVPNPSAVWLVITGVQPAKTSPSTECVAVVKASPLTTAEAFQYSSEILNSSGASKVDAGVRSRLMP